MDYIKKIRSELETYSGVRKAETSEYIRSDQAVVKRVYREIEEIKLVIVDINRDIKRDREK